MRQLLNYTRLPINEEEYSPKLAYSMHLALWEDGQWMPLNHNSGVLFARATENSDGSLNAKSLKNPWVFSLREGGYGVLALRTEADGSADTEDCEGALLWTTENFLEYKERGVLALGSAGIEKISCGYCQDKNRYVVKWCGSDDIWYEAESSDLCSLRLDTPAEQTEVSPPAFNDTPEYAIPHNSIEIPDELATYLCQKLITPEIVSLDVPEKIQVATAEELKNTTLTAHYSDGTQVQKKVLWELDGVDFDTPGAYPVQGTVCQKHFPFPIAENRADPCVCLWQGKYYFIATNDADENHTLYIRESDSLEGLLQAEEHLLLDSHTYPGIGGLLWAPEFHVINGRLYIFHGATPEPFFCEESHIMELREGGNPICRDDWSAPRRILRKDGSDLCEAGKTISLDMTHFVWENSHYVIWSQRQFLPKDLGAWLYIAKLDPEKPWQLLTDPVVLSKPEYGWANNHVFVDEGPYALARGNTLYVTFSSALVDTTYVVGLLQIKAGQDLLCRENWKKTNYPILTSRSVPGEYGTGHNAYVTDEDGTVWNTYHARPGLDGPRCSGIRRVHFDVDGCPVLDVTEEKDLKPEFRRVQTTCILS